MIPPHSARGAIQFEVREKVEDFDYYKEKFENYQDIEDRVIGGITFHGRTYKYIGYEWIQYIAQIDDTRAFSIGPAGYGLCRGHDAGHHSYQHEISVVQVFCRKENR